MAEVGGRWLFALLIYVLFFFSGATGLVYEVTWTRMFASVFGNTTYAVSAVLSAFMAGLALGSILIGRFIDARSDELKVYALLELGIGLTALGVAPALEAFDLLYALIYQKFSASAWALNAIRLAGSSVLLLVPTSLMGATLPVLSKFAVEGPGQVPTRVGLLYALNTLGASSGCFVTGFVLLEHLGVRGSCELASAGNLALAGGFGLLSRAGGSARAPLPPAIRASAAPQVSGRISLALVLAAAGLAGFTSLGYEVLWSRLLVFKLKTTVYAFAIMLTTFLAGIGLGSALLAGIERSFGVRDYPRALGLIEGGIGLFGLGSIFLFGRLDPLFGARASSWSVHTLEQMLLAACIMLPSTLLMGAAFPVISRICAHRRQGIGAAIGEVYSTNTSGSVLGALVTGFWLVQAQGTQNSLVSMAFLNLLIATVFLWRAPARTPGRGRLRRSAPAALAWVLVLAATSAIPGDLLFQFYNTGEREVDSRVEILQAVEDPEGIATIHRLPSGDRVISTGSINVAGTSFTLRSTQKLQAHIPMLLHPRPEQVLQIGFGSGETAHILTTYPIRQLDVAEISQGVLEAASTYFRDLNQGVTADPRFNALVMDGANYLRLTDRRYDVIMNDSIWPFYAGNSGLYTREHFLAGREHLEPGGLMTSWLPLEMQLESFKTILKTFHSVFPYFSVWVATTHYTKHALLVGSLEPLHLDAVDYLQRFEQYAREDLAAVELADPLLLLDCFAADETGLEGELEGVPLHTADRPILEFAPSKPVYQSQLAVYEMLARHRKPILPHLRHVEELGGRQTAFAEALRQTYLATGHVLRGMILREQRQPGFAAEFEQALQLRPGHPGALENLSYAEHLRHLELGAVEGRSYQEVMGLADRLVKAGFRDKATAVLEEAIKREPNRAQPYEELGLVLAESGHLEEAVRRFAQALALNPEDAQTHHNLGNVLWRQNRLEEAAAHYRRALWLDPALAEAYYSLGMLLQEQGKSGEAIRELEKALALRPNYVKAHVNLGILLDAQGQLENAIEHFQQAVRSAPGDATVCNNLIVGLVRAGRLGEAQEHFEQAAGRQVDLPTARRVLVGSLSALAQSRAEQGDLEAAGRYLRQAIHLALPEHRGPLIERLKSYK